MAFTPLDDEIRSLLERLAGGFFQDDVCMCCEARRITMNQEAITNIHVANCPVLRARRTLAAQGTPVKLFHITYTVRSQALKEVMMGQHVIRGLLSEDEALDLALLHLARDPRKWHLEPASVAIQEISVVPCEEIIFRR